jgi:ParB-like chromosome segregation protein Spo0J
MRQIERIPIDVVVVPSGHRPVNPDTVAAIAESMLLVGQLQPILVREVAGEAHLDAGRHRVEAVKKNGWKDIDAIFVVGDEIDIRLREISENLHRSDLTPLERSEQIVEWSKLIKEKQERDKPAQAAQVSGGRGNKGGAAQAARDLDIDRDAIRRAEKIAKITPEAKQAAIDSGMDKNQSALLKVADAPPEAQAAKVEEIATAKKKRKQPAKKPKPLAREDDEEVPVVITDEEVAQRWEETLGYLAGDAIAMEAGWLKSFGPKWKKYEVTSATLTLVRQARDAWQSLLSDLLKRDPEHQTRAKEFSENFESFMLGAPTDPITASAEKRKAENAEAEVGQ